MPVPTSSLIFALAAAVPFGLAIKDTVTGKYDLPQPIFDENSGALVEEDGDEELRSQALEEYRQRRNLEEAQREVELATERAAQKKELEGVFGVEIATIGSRFDHLKLGEPKSTTDLSALYPGHDVALLDDGINTHTLFIRVDSDSAVCDLLDEALADAWGTSKGESYHKVWVNQAIGQRAILESSSHCTLTFEKIAPIESWLAKTPASLVPMAMIGRPAKQLRDALGARVSVLQEGGANDPFSWVAPGLGTGSGTTAITAYVKAGRVVGLLASTTIDDATNDLVVERITTLTGKQPMANEDDLDAPRTWKTTPKIVLEGDSQIFLRIGEQRD